MMKPAATARVIAADDIDDTRRRYFDPVLKVTVVSVFQGDFYITARPGEMLSTVLGSCIAACIRDPIAGVGGMNHFLLPDAGGADGGGAGVELRYGSYSMEQLINGILSRGGRRERLEVKVFGGANVIRSSSAVGHRNADFIEGYLTNEGLAIGSRHLRGTLPRKIQYFPASGLVRMKEIAEVVANRVFERETAHQVRLRPSPAAGSIELFD
ncbi:MAG: chemoreceptor glutamine deamidase CheD [Magnetospirillum sp. WYHS-4]